MSVGRSCQNVWREFSSALGKPGDPGLDSDSVVSPECCGFVVIPHSNTATYSQQSRPLQPYYGQLQLTAVAIQIKSELHVCDDVPALGEDDHESSLLISHPFQISHGHLVPLISAAGPHRLLPPVCVFRL